MMGGSPQLWLQTWPDNASMARIYIYNIISSQKPVHHKERIY